VHTISNSSVVAHDSTAVDDHGLTQLRLGVYQAERTDDRAFRYARRWTDYGRRVNECRRQQVAKDVRVRQARGVVTNGRNDPIETDWPDTITLQATKQLLFREQHARAARIDYPVAPACIGIRVANHSPASAASVFRDDTPVFAGAPEQDG
jgi:hypothetical protein